MAIIGDKLHSNSLSNQVFYDANGIPQELAQNCLLSTLIVESVDGLGKATKLGPITSASSSTTISASENFLGKIGGFSLVSSATITRPADTTAYLALDAVSNSTSAPTVLTFANIARVVGGSGILTKFRLMTDQKTCTARFRLHLFHTAPTAINDNAGYGLLFTNAGNRLGQIDFPAMTTENATNSTAANTSNITDRMPFVLPTGTSLFGILETLDAFIPASAQNFYLELTASLD